MVTLTIYLILGKTIFTEWFKTPMPFQSLATHFNGVTGGQSKVIFKCIFCQFAEEKACFTKGSRFDWLAGNSSTTPGKFCNFHLMDSAVIQSLLTRCHDLSHDIYSSGVPRTECKNVRFLLARFRWVQRQLRTCYWDAENPIERAFSSYSRSRSICGFFQPIWGKLRFFLFLNS